MSERSLYSLQAGRFFAATAVMLHHAAISLDAFATMPPSVAGILEYGYLGVDFFFVLSGFIIHYTMSRSPKTLKRFAYDRFTRIFIPYWPIAVALLVAYALLPSMSAANRGWSVVPSLTLLPWATPPALSVAWTLQHELIFYAVYAFLFHFGRLAEGLLIWLTFIAVASSALISPHPALAIPLASINVEFIAGVFAAEMFMRKAALTWLQALGVAAVCFSAFVLLLEPDGSGRWLFGLSLACLLPNLCAAEQHGRVTVPRWLILGGAASYALYLVHNPLLSVLSRSLGRYGAPWGAALVLEAVICFAVALAYYAVWERPMMRLSRRVVIGRTDKRDHTSPASRAI